MAYREDINHIYAANKRACGVVAGKLDLKLPMKLCIKLLQLLHMRIPVHQLSLPSLPVFNLYIGLKFLIRSQQCEWR